MKLSVDGTKVYYSGFKDKNLDSNVLSVIDVAAHEEKRLATYPTSLDVIYFMPSNDNKFIVVMAKQPSTGNLYRDI